MFSSLWGGAKPCGHDLHYENRTVDLRRAMTVAKVRWRDVKHPRQVYDCMTAVSILDNRWHKHHFGSDRSEFTVEGFYQPHFEAGSPGVRVSTADLGSTCLTQIAGFVCLVTLPSLPESLERDQPMSLQRPHLHHQWLREADWTGFGRIESKWGTADVHGGQGFVQAFRLAVCPQEAPLEEAGHLVQQELPFWWSRVAAWVELLSASHLRAVDDFHWSQGSSALYILSSGGRPQSVPASSWIGRAPRLTSAWRTPSYWPNALQLAGLDQSPPLPCTLLVAAVRAFREGEYRTCVAESGTAAEVALREALRRISKPAGDKDTLGVLASNARRSIQGLVPAVFQQRMVQVRNRVVHDGALIDAETAAFAYTLAQHVVHLVHPLPQVDSSGLIVERVQSDP